ncbi:hypothetical protein [uncultured Aliiroseovarius sp.]|uniref:hypothetical protein n=1 Tax=uncultured Aliiroseovarius sp. TaxID=1658783 RepID=UPI0025995B58|nr:hypothetical protein [uncultured Aliiroseovarius sp.]
MSYDTDMSIWVGDLDGYINIDAISRANELEAEQDALEADLDNLGDITLFSNQAISSRRLHSRGVNPEQWRWMLHRAEKSFGQMDTQEDIERAFLKATMSLSRRYAVARYAGFEGLSFSSAVTAIFPHGIRALLFSYMAGEQSLSDPSCRKEIQGTLHLAASTPNLTAYDQTGIVRRKLHKLAVDAAGKDAHLKLDREKMRSTLSLLRLYFANRECQVSSASELEKMYSRYESARAAEKQGFDTSQRLTGKRIENWRLRSLQPLTFFFPFSVRNSLKRLIDQEASSACSIDHETSVNELALTYCEIELMRERAKKRDKRSE